MILYSIRHDWPEKAGFMISRPQGHTKYTFLHFLTPVQIRIGDTVVHAQPGACIFFSPGTPQWFWGEVSIIHNWMHATDALTPLLTRLQIPADRLLYPQETNFISELFRKMEQEHFSDRPERELLIDSYLTEFMIKFSRALQSLTPVEAVSREMRIRLQDTRQQILSQPERKWTVAQMASLAALSPSRFHAVYKATFATTPLQDLIEARVRYAKSLLLASESVTLPSIAEALGYHDQFQFIRQFKSLTGMTPGVYRKSNR